jgi:hypothetical protein
MKFRRLLMWAAVMVGLFLLYTVGISTNPPGYFVDESALSYNAHLISQTGAAEFGPRLPLFIQFYTGPFMQFGNPTAIYLLAVAYFFLGPGILISRLVAAAVMFAACVLLGWLAARVSGRSLIGVIVGLIAAATPWLFELGRLVLDPYVYPLVTVLFLWAVYRAHEKSKWELRDQVLIALTLGLLTYSYTIGRLLAPLLALGLVSFAVTRHQRFAVAKTWLLFGLTLIPLLVFGSRNPQLNLRFYQISYIQPDSTLREIAGGFVRRYLGDIDPVIMLMRGDQNPRHHLADALGSFFITVFILAAVGFLVVLIRRRQDPWWRFVAYGALASVIPGALTVDRFHSLRLIAYPIFLLLLMTPVLEWLPRKGEYLSVSHLLKSGAIATLLLFCLIEAGYFHWKFLELGDARGYAMDAAYKPLYDAAVAQNQRPIYLVDDYYGPAYIHSFWYATLEGRSTNEFVHVDYRVRAPAGSIVISTEAECTDCELIRRSGLYLLYRVLH